MSVPSDSPGASDAGKRALRPRDAATLVVVEATGPEPRVLMGRRRADLVFMPGKFVFPGGRVDPSDRQVASADRLDPCEEQKLISGMKGTPSPERARAIALAAIRETYEEAGLLIGAATVDGVSAASGAPRAGSPGGTPGPATWQPFLSHGVVPRLGALTLFARAITPPGRPRRYDTRFFALDAREIALRVPPPDAELQSLDWFTLDEARSLELPSITRAVVEDLADRIASGLHERRTPVPFYYFRNGSFRRELIAV